MDSCCRGDSTYVKEKLNKFIAVAKYFTSLVVHGAGAFVLFL